MDKQLTKKQKEFIEKKKKSHIELYSEKMNYKMPLEIIMDMINNKDTAAREVLAGAGMLLPYTESKLPSKVESTGEVVHTVIDDRQKSLIASLDDNDVPELINIKPENVIEHEDNENIEDND